ncbi:MAG: PilC/PilY family type IV pilus protein [Gammaproteobacteria bacterium]|nr:PilC/PilY family type IV pilus protein [Gammaproteobacteria bacterium]
MNQATRNLFRLASAAAMLVIAGAAAADDTEIFTGAGNVVSAQRPNILFIFDTSGSMSTNVATQSPFNPATTYTGGCSQNRIYFQTGSNTSNPPSCSDNNSVPVAAFKCDASSRAIAQFGNTVARAGQWRPQGNTNNWRTISVTNSNTAWVECATDAGVHGDGVNTAKLWAANGAFGPWSATAAQGVNWPGTGNDYAFFSGNYVNWLNGSGAIVQSRIAIMQQVAIQTIDQLAVSNNVNVGLMRFSSNNNNGCSDTTSAEGGMVLREMNAVAANATAIKNDIAAMNASGCTPLSETMYEAYLYLSGASVRYGLNSRTSPGVSKPSVLSSRQAADTNLYQSPLTTSCQKNFIVLLTDGEPTADNSADTAIQSLIGGTCTGTGDGRCLEEIAKYMYEHDLRPALAGLQNVTTYTIGFGPDVRGSTALRNTANGAGGVFYEATDTATLSTVLTNIVRTILAFNTSFTAPAVSVNAFNRTQNLNDLYITVFKPSETYAWLGNLKKYRLSPLDGTIRDAVDAPAVEFSTGFFRTTAQSFWNSGVDGDDVRLGGAAARLPIPASRNVYSNITSLSPLSALANQVTVANAAITIATLGLAPLEAPGRDALINWMRGADIADENGNGSTTDARYRMGDPFHGRPATVIYGGSVGSPDPNDGVLYAVTNEGYLHAISTVDGSELWAFVPQQLLARARNMYVNAAVANRTYGLDGNIRVVKNEVNENGIVEPLLGETVRIYFGMRMGGSEYYGLDVTNRNAPTFLFKIGPSEAGLKRMPNAGQSWSTPTVTHVNVSGATQNSLQQVLVFGGGYDTVQENGPYALDSSGNQIFIVDAVSGNRLWYAGPSSDAGANLRHASMTHSIPGDVRAFDLTGDGYADRMYAADMGGRVWRFDIHNGQPVSTLVTGGVFASLGNAHLGTHPNTSTRRFYSTPDVSFLTQGGRSWMNLALGSGYRGHPLNVATQDRFYSLRDYRPFASLTQAQYDSATVITEADVTLVDVTSDINPAIPVGASGWRMDLRRPAAAWTGEKSLSEARTVQSIIQFSTYEPNSASIVSSNSCAPGVGVNRLYSVSAYTGAPVLDRENPEDPPDSTDDRDTELSQGGIAPEVVWLFPSPDDPVNCVGEDCRPPPECLVGLENCGVGINLAPVRTFWRQTGVN